MKILRVAVHVFIVAFALWAGAAVQNAATTRSAPGRIVTLLPVADCTSILGAIVVTADGVPHNEPEMKVEQMQAIAATLPKASVAPIQFCAEAREQQSGRL